MLDRMREKNVRYRMQGRMPLLLFSCYYLHLLLLLLLLVVVLLLLPATYYLLTTYSLMIQLRSRGATYQLVISSP